MKKRLQTSSSGRGTRKPALWCEYSFSLVCRCPVNPATVDSYTVKVTSRRMIKVEKLLEVAATFEGRVVFQEALTVELARLMRAEVETTGRHSGVATKAVAK